jgi:hypothetical protein
MDETLLALNEASPETQRRQLEALVLAHGKYPVVAAFREVATQAPAPRTRPPSRPTRASGPPDSDVALNTHDLATADTDRAPAASRTVRPVVVEISGLRPALRGNRSPTHHKDPFPLISLLPRPLLLREQLCLRRVR